MHSIIQLGGLKTDSMWVKYIYQAYSDTSWAVEIWHSTHSRPKLQLFLSSSEHQPKKSTLDTRAQHNIIRFYITLHIHKHYNIQDASLSNLKYTVTIVITEDLTHISMSTGPCLSNVPHFVPSQNTHAKPMQLKLIQNKGKAERQLNDCRHFHVIDSK